MCPLSPRRHWPPHWAGRQRTSSWPTPPRAPTGCGWTAAAMAVDRAPQLPRHFAPHTGEPSGHKKAPTLRCGAWARAGTNRPSTCSELLGCGSASSSGGSSVSGSLGSVGSRSSVSSRSGGWSSSCVGSSRSCGFGGRSGCSGRSFHGSGSRCWSGLFLLATSGECSSSDQGGQNERVLHFDFPSWTDRILKSHSVRPTEALVRIGTKRLICTFLAQPPIILIFSQY